MDNYDPAALARKFVSAQGDIPTTSPVSSTPADAPLITSDTPLNLRPSQVASAPTPFSSPEPDPSISATSSPSGPSISSLSAPTPDLPEPSTPTITADTPVSPAQKKPKKPHRPKNIPLLISLSVFSALILGFFGYFIYFYYLSDSFTGATQTAIQSSLDLAPSSALSNSSPAPSQKGQEVQEDQENTKPTAPNPSSTSESKETSSSQELELNPNDNSNDTLLTPTADNDKLFSRLSGEPISTLAEDSAPTFCVQIPNGVDGARPQVGLSSAKIVFEAIAESGITRFAAVFQNPPVLVGPVRSLRIYYLNWDTPFDCIVVHAGGADDALSALRANNYRELDESSDYMFRDQTDPSRLWNNLFAPGASLSSFAQNMGYLSSDIKSFPRLTPARAKIAKINAQATHPLVIDQPSSGNTSELSPKVQKISLKFGDMPTFNPVYTYNPSTNSYLRAYESGTEHLSLDCSALDSTTTLSAVPTSSCKKVPLSPTTVIAMVVQESRATYDNYHENISSIGAGDAYIFQNGDVTLGTWEKSSASAQIIFRDKNDQEISLVPGQTWISAIPAYGAVSYE